jgi:hypothetical protein
MTKEDQGMKRRRFQACRVEPFSQREFPFAVMAS